MSEQQMHYNEAGTHVLMVNEAGDRIEVGPDAVPYYLTRGDFSLAEPNEEPSYDGLFDDASAEGEAQTGFDPSEHGVDEVSAHLAAHAENSPGEVVRVLELERAGKNRKSVVVPEGFDSLGE